MNEQRVKIFTQKGEQPGVFSISFIHVVSI